MKTPELPLPIQERLINLPHYEGKELRERLQGSFQHYEFPEVRGLLATAELSLFPMFTATLLYDAGKNIDLGTAGLIKGLVQAQIAWLIPTVVLSKKWFFPLDEIKYGKPLSHIPENAYSKRRWTQSVEEFCRSEGIR